MLHNLRSPGLPSPAVRDTLSGRARRSVITETTISDDQDGPAPGEGFHLLAMSPEIFVSRPLPVSGTVTIGRSSKCAVRIEDPLASREHARLHIDSEGKEAALSIEDAGSVNGTRVRDLAVQPGQRVPIVPGEAVVIGATVIMVLRDRPTVGSRRIWSHAYFEYRVEDECARAAATGTPFAL